MNIEFIKSQLDSVSEIKPIGKDFDIDGVNYQLIGFVRNGKFLSAVLIAYSEELRDKLEQDEIEELTEDEIPPEERTLRDMEKDRLSFDEKFLSVSEIISGEHRFLTTKSEMSLFSPEEHMILLTEFIRRGWSFGRFGNINLDFCYIFTARIKGKYSSIPDIDLSKIELSFRPVQKVTLAEIPLTIRIGKNDNKIILPNGEEILILNAELKDMYAEIAQTLNSEEIRKRLTEEEIEEQYKSFSESFSRHCPRDKRLLSVEYEAPSGISVNIKLKSELDSPPSVSRDCSTGFIFLSSDKEKPNSKFCVLEPPLDPNTKEVEAEIFTVSELIQPDKIIIE